MAKPLLTTLLLLPLLAIAEPESYYQKSHCKGEIEYRLPDRTRVDCLTLNHAIEYDFARKWAEAVGQALHYAAMTGKRAGIVLIVREEKDVKYLHRLDNLIDYHSLPVDVWVVTKTPPPDQSLPE